MNRADLISMTQTNGERWGYPHVQRVLALSERIGRGLEYHPDWLWFAVHLHDWGAFPRYRIAGVDHALRSRQVAEQEILPNFALPADAAGVVLEAIERHDYRDLRPVHSNEALLLREADFLDFLGPLGAAREFAWGPNDLKQVVTRIRQRIAGIRGRFSLPAAQELAEERIRAAETFLEQIENDSFGYL
jgi:uncharacterized protein